MKTNFNLGKILNVVADFYQIDTEKIICSSRKKEFVTPRQVYMYMAHEHTDKTLCQISSFIKRDHATAVYSIAKIRVEKEIYKKLKYELEQINEMLVPSLVIQDVDLLLLTNNYTNSFINLS